MRKAIAVALGVLAGLVGHMIDTQSVQAAEVLILCSNEGGTCYVPNTSTTVTYGRDGAVVTTSGVTQIGCNSGDFKADPLVGKSKTCSYVIDPNTVAWTDCASEGETCSFAGAKLVRYGSSRWVYRSFVSGVSCNNGSFGDPEFGTPKRCQVAN